MLTRKEAKLLGALGQRKNREAEGCFLAEGARVGEDLLASPLRIRLLVYSSSMEDTARGRDLLARCERRGVRTEMISERELAGFAGTQTPQGVLAVGEIPAGGLEQVELPRSGAVLLVLDAVQDPGNFGTLVRAAEALGAAGVVALPGTTDPWSPKAVRAAAGSNFRLPVVAS
ncbi:MAG TPA: RNA methyltransferase, partial [Longimicrobiaceae bacterium]|nr:RNA methyltransferase [Longimicrobiaceae bacterium]